MNKLIGAVAGIALVLGLFACWTLLGGTLKTNGAHPSFGAVGNLLAENYIPYVLYNGGFNTAKDLTVSGATTLSGTNVFSGATTISGASTFSAIPTFSSILQLDAGAVHSYPNSTTTNATQTLVAADITNYESIVALPNVGSITLTLPASSTLSAFVPNAGDWQEQCIVNATTTTGIIVTLAGGTGVNLQVASSSVSAVGSLALLPGKTGCIKYFRIGAGGNSSDINALLTVFK